jgi:membrane-associated protease RseP (regulator of RpoE activity)
MIGRIKNKRLSVIGADSAEGLREWLQPFFDACELEEVTNAPPGGSDHLPFMQRGVPYLFSIIADFHSDYHTPRDVSWKINREDAVRTVELYHSIALAAAQRPERLQFKAPEPRQNRRSGGEGRLEIRVRFGIQPGYGEGEEAGIPVEAVTPDSPAEKAGLKAGDRIVSWDDDEVNSVEEWMPMLASQRPGDVVRVGIIRDGTDMTLKVTLEER